MEARIRMDSIDNAENSLENLLKYVVACVCNFPKIRVQIDKLNYRLLNEQGSALRFQKAFAPVFHRVVSRKTRKTVRTFVRL